MTGSDGSPAGRPSARAGRPVGVMTSLSVLLTRLGSARRILADNMDKPKRETLQISNTQPVLLAGHKADRVDPAHVHSFLHISEASVEAAIIVKDRRLFVWAVDNAQSKRPVSLSIQIDGRHVFSQAIVAPRSREPVDTGVDLRPFRGLIFSANGHTTRAPAFDDWIPFPDSAKRRALLAELRAAPTVLSKEEQSGRLWTEIPDLMQRLDRDTAEASRALPSAYLRFLQNRYEPSLKLSGPRDVADWIFSVVLEEPDKRTMFFLTERLRESLTEPLLNKQVLRQEITLALFSFWRRHYSNLDIFSEPGLRAVQYKFVTAPFIGEKNNRMIVTPDMQKGLSSPVETIHDIELPWSWYWVFLHEDLKTSKSLHDLVYTRMHSWKETVKDLLQPDRLSFSPAGWRSYWAARPSGHASGLTRFDLSLISLLGEVNSPEAAIAERGKDYWTQQLQREIYHPIPELSPLSGIDTLPQPMPRRQEHQRRELAIVGHFNGTGLGRNFKMFVEAFAETDLLLFNADDGACLNPDEAYLSGKSVRAKTVILCVNADRSPDVVARLAHVCEGARLIGFYLWETDQPPPHHGLGSRLVDEIWVPTAYIAAAYRKITEVPIAVIGKGLKPPPPPHPASRFKNIKKDAFVFLTLSEFGSGIIRKNPLDVIRAFQKAFPGDEPVELWLKVRKIEPKHWSNQDGYWESIEELMSADPRLKLIDGDLSEDDYWSLLHHVDAFVSLHRSEGFGYGLADALACGKPVIASDYSGSVDFCDNETAFLVPVEIEVVPPPYMNATTYIGSWGKPDVSMAAEAMRSLFQDQNRAKEVASAGGRRIREQYNFEKWKMALAARLKDANQLNPVQSQKDIVP